MIRKGCESCRRRHVKCTLSENASVCDKCAELGQQCELAPSYRFCPVHSVFQKGLGGSKYEFSWDSSQQWVEIISPGTSICAPGHSASNHSLTRDTVNFVTETPDDSSVELPKDCGNGNLSPSAHNNGIATQEYTRATQALPMTSESTSVHQHDQEYQYGMFDVYLPPATPANSTIGHTSVYTDPEESVSSRQEHCFLEPSTPERYTIELTTREAFLMRSYTRKVAPWFDVCDPLSHFGNEVPRRALDNPMVMYAILALASRHQAIMTRTTDEEFEQNTYHGRCLELLIPALSRPENTYNDHLLTTIVLLRQHEELENRKDTRYHLVASIKLINMISKFSSSGGLAEAASWLFLRQAIYASLVQREPWQLQLENYERSRVFISRDDCSYANVSVFQLARALRLVSRQSDNDSLLERQEWESLEEDVSRWKINSPSSFRPLRYREPDAERGRPFSEVCMISGATERSPQLANHIHDAIYAAIGLQYYYATLIVLQIHKPRSPGISAFESARVRNTGEIATVKYLLDIIGLAISNEGVENANFTASHFIFSYGYCLSMDFQRRGVVSFLRNVEESMGWRVSWIIEDLSRQWREMDSLKHGQRKD